MICYFPERLLLGPGLGLERGLHGVEGARVVLLGVVELLLLLLDAAVDLLPHLRKKKQTRGALPRLQSSVISGFQCITVSCSRGAFKWVKMGNESNLW